MIPASSLRSRFRCCGGRQPAASRGPGGLAGALRGSPRAPVPGTPGMGRAGSAGGQERPAAGAGRAPSSQPGAPVGGRLFGIFFFENSIKKNKTKKQKKGNKYLTVSLCAYPSQGLKGAGRSAAGRAVPNLSRDCGRRRGAAPGAAGGR